MRLVWKTGHALLLLGGFRTSCILKANIAHFSLSLDLGTVADQRNFGCRRHAVLAICVVTSTG